MAEKLFNTRIQLKYDTWANWSKEDVAGQGANLVLKKGEIGICEIPSGNSAATTAPTVLFKVGNGTDTFKALPWASAKAADVHAWAKMSQDDFVGNFLNIESSDGPNIAYKIHEQFPSYEDLNNAIQGVKDDMPTELGVMSVAAEDNSIYVNNTDPANPKVAVNFADEDERYNVTFTVDNGGVHGNVSLSNYKIKQTAVADPEVPDEGDGYLEANQFIASITQNENGEIVATKRAMDKDYIRAVKVNAAGTADKVKNTLIIQANGTQVDTYDGSKQTTINITAADLGLSGAMHFLGTSSTEITDGGAQKPTIGGKQITSLNLGDVVLYGSQEYVYTLFVDDEGGEMRCWELLGDEGSYALKSVKIEAGTGLEITAGGTLAENTTIGIKANGITGDMIQDDAIDGDHITTNAITDTHINANAVTTNKIKDGAVTGGKIAASAVSTAKIADGAVTTAKIEDLAITSAKIANSAITSAHIGEEVITYDHIGQGAVDSYNIAANAITTAKISNKAVTTDKLDDKAVTTEKVADKAIGAEQTKAYIAKVGDTSEETWVFYCGTSTDLV